MTGRQTLRAAWLRVHRWLGLVLGAWFVLMGLTGSLLAFHTDLEPWFDSRLAPRPAAGTPSIEAVVQALRAAHPQRQDGWHIELPAPGDALVTARYLRPAEAAGRAFAPLLVTVDSNTNRVVASRFWGDTTMTWVYDLHLHYELRLGLTGRQAVALAGVALAVSLFSGAWLWWPQAGRWRQALGFKWDAGTQRRVYDLHKWAGLAALPLLLVQGLSGSVLGWPQLYGPVVRLLGPAVAWPHPASGSAGPRLSVDEVLAVVRARWPQAQLRWVEVPGNDPAAAYRVRMRLPGEPGERFPAGHVWLDARTGAVLAVRTPAQFSASDVFQQWLRPLHTGEALGLAGRILLCLSGLLPLALIVTGTLRWMHKRRALRANRGAARTTAPARSRPAALAGAKGPRGVDR